MLLMLTLLSACETRPDDFTSTKSDVSAFDSNVSYQSDIGNRPLTQKISAFIEGGEEESFIADLKTGSNGKYTIYIFNDSEQDIIFEFKISENGDVITPKNKMENSLYNGIYMRIVSSDGSFELPEKSRDEDGFTIEYDRVTKGTDIFDIETYYWDTPLPNPVTLMKSMLDTLVINE